MEDRMTTLVKEKAVGQRLNFQYGTAPQEVQGREVSKKNLISKRAAKLLNDYYESKCCLDNEFPYWYTRTYIEKEGELPIIRRSLAIKKAFEKITPMIRPGELLVMQKTRFVRGCYIMPWTANRFPLSVADQMEDEAANAAKRSLEDITVCATGGGNVTESAGNVLSISRRFGIRAEEYPVLVDICKYWVNKSSEDICWHAASIHPQYEAHLKMKQAVLMHFDLEYSVRHGRNVVNYQYPLQLGFKGMIEKCQKHINDNLNDGSMMDAVAFWTACINVIQGVQAWIRNYAEEARKLMAKPQYAEYRDELALIAERLDWIAENKPRGFADALQLCWLCHIAVTNELQGSGFAPGRLGQVLYPYYKKDIEEGKITVEQAIELLECMRVKFTEIDIAMSVGTIGLLAGSTFNNICIGGLRPDGSPAENELEFLFIEAAMRCQTPQPTMTLLYDSKTSEKFIQKAIECNKTGAGFPAYVNNRVAMDYLFKTFGQEGITLEDARAWTIGGCLEIQPGALVNGEFGAGSYSSTGVGFVNMPKTLEMVLWNGMDPRTKTVVYAPHNSKLETFDEFMRVWKMYFKELIITLENMFNYKNASMFDTDNPVFYSALMADCIEKGKDIDRAGSRYNRCFTTWISGQVNLANALASIKKNVYEDKNFTLDELKEALEANFGYVNAMVTRKFSMVEQKLDDSKYARIHNLCLCAPKFGNDDPYVDAIYKDVIEFWRDVTVQVQTVFGHPWTACQLSVATHGPLGQACIASADGRLAGLTLADGAQSPYPGTDLNGPYALLNSATSFEHSDYQNTQLNFKLHPSSIKGTEGARKLAHLLKAYMEKGGYHIQFNVVDSRMLRDAQANPDNYRDLLVRVAGFTQYWVELSKPIQDEVVSRTEYEELG